MRTILILVAIIAATSITSYAADGADIFKKYEKIVNGEKDSSSAIRKGGEYLSSLKRDEFIAFIRETSSRSEYSIKNPDSGVAMLSFAESYLRGPGKDEATTQTLSQVSDQNMPESWRLGILNGLRIDSRRNIKQNEFQFVTQTLTNAGLSEKNSDLFRFLVMNKLGSILQVQRHLIVKRNPDFKKSLDDLNVAELPKNNNADVDQARSIITEINLYKHNLDKINTQLKNEEVKANMKKRMAALDRTLFKINRQR